MTNKKSGCCCIAGYFSQESGMSDGMVIGKLYDIATTGEHPPDTDAVLIVDDEQDVLELAAELLQTLGYDVLTAPNGFEALAVLRKNSRISILFTDIQMPDMGGEDLAETALASRPDIRVIFTSGYSRPRAEAPFLQKPYKVTDLIRVLAPQPVSSLRP
jgi:CheY-like chemotaxis protein